MDAKGIRGKNNNKAHMMSSHEDNIDHDDMDLRRGPWTLDEDHTLMNYIAIHGEGRWNTLANSAGLKRTGKSCRLRWLNYLRPDVRRGNITLEEQLLILELHTRWGNRWSKIANYLPGRTDNEIKNYWRTRVQKLAKQLKCDVNSKQFKDTMRYLWMPRLVERIQAAAATTTTTTSTIATNNTYTYSYNNNEKITMGSTPTIINNEFVSSNSQPSYNSNTTASSDSFENKLSTISDLGDNYNNYCTSVSNKDNPNHDLDYYYQPYSHDEFFSQGLMDFQSMQLEPNMTWMQNGDSSGNIWNDENMLFLQQQLMNDTM